MLTIHFKDRTPHTCVATGKDLWKSLSMMYTYFDNITGFTFTED